jgi:hypothetical protein
VGGAAGDQFGRHGRSPDPRRGFVFQSDLTERLFGASPSLWFGTEQLGDRKSATLVIRFEPFFDYDVPLQWIRASAAQRTCLD